MVVRKLSKREGRISELIENPKENLELIGLYTVVLRLVEEGKFEGAEESPMVL